MRVVVSVRDDRRSAGAVAGIATYLVLAFGLSYAGQIAIWLVGGIDGPLFGIIAPVIMFTPAVAAFFGCRSSGQPFLRLLTGFGHISYVVAGILVPAVSALAVAYAIHTLFGGEPPPFAIGPGLRLVEVGPPFLVRGEQGLPLFIGNLLATAVLFSGLAGLLAVGEEIGWRGFLQPRLTTRFGTLTGLTLVGVAWAFWHLPLILQGYVFPASPVLGGIVLFPLMGIGLSLFLGWLRIRSKAIWSAVLAHGSYNAFFSIVVFNMDFAGRAIAAYLVILAMTLLTGLLAAVLLITPRCRMDIDGPPRRK